MPNQSSERQNPDCPMKEADKIFFTKNLKHWNSTGNGRKMPWKGEKNPYRVWLSEIILQQTRVQQGTAYYNRFITAYPTIVHLAAAPEAEVYKIWEGLGYYRRCKNMLATAREIVNSRNGKFPDTIEEIQSLKGIGPYTSAAIASFAFDLAHAVLDGNVYRVLARYFGIAQSIDTAAGKKYFAELAQTLLDKKEPALYNQAIMDFGATICKPLPECSICPLQNRCVAFLNDTTTYYPVKEKKKERVTRWFYYVIAEINNGLYVKLRTGKDIWQNLHEFYLLPCDHELSLDEITTEVLQKFNDAQILDISRDYRQHLTHQTIRGKFVHIRLQEDFLPEGYMLLEKEELSKIAFPRYVTTYFQDSRILNQL